MDRSCKRSFSWAKPMKSKEAKYVASFLFDIFMTFGAPRILHSDNGKEFVAQIIKDLTALYPKTVIINGRPRHPQSQGLVEKGNDILEMKLSAWLEDNRREDWSFGLPMVTCQCYYFFEYNILLVVMYHFIHVIINISTYIVGAMNTQTCTATGKTPYELVFGQAPRSNFALMKELYDQGIRDEEDIPENVDVQDSESVSNGIVDYCNSNNNENETDHTPRPPFYAQTMKKYGNLQLKMYIKM